MPTDRHDILLRHLKLKVSLGNSLGLESYEYLALVIAGFAQSLASPPCARWFSNFVISFCQLVSARQLGW